MKTISSEAQHKRMLEAPLFKLLIAQAIPTTIVQLVTLIYNTADTWFVSQIGTSASAAVGVNFALMSIIQAIGFGIGMGAGSLISLNLGKKENEKAYRYASSAFAIVLLLGIIIGALGLLTLTPLMRLLGSTDSILPFAKDYARLILCAAPFMCGSFVLNNILRSEGEARFGMYGMCAGGIINMGLDPLFIFAFDMGISGAALATAISQLISFCILLSQFLMKKSFIPLKPSYISFKPKTYLKIITTGFPTICRQGLASVATALLNSHAAVYGDAAIAAMTIANRMYMLVRNVVVGIGQGFQPIAGYNYGAGNKARTKKAFWLVCLLGTIVCVVSGIILTIFAEPIMTAFRDDIEVIKIGKTALPILCIAIPFMGYSTYVNQLYQSLGFRVRATFLASCRQGIFFIPLCFILPAAFGLTGVQLLQPVSDILTFIACFLCMKISPIC